MTVEELKKNDDWAHVFGEQSDGNTDGLVEVCQFDTGVTQEEVLRNNVKQVIASADGSNDEADWVGVFEMNDGRFLIAVAWCDYTGWDCQASNSLTVFSSLENAMKYGLDDAQKLRLWFDGN